MCYARAFRVANSRRKEASYKPINKSISENPIAGNFHYMREPYWIFALYARKLFHFMRESRR